MTRRASDEEGRIVPKDVIAFGSAERPRPPRAGTDITLDELGQVDLEYDPYPFPRGASTFADISRVPLRGFYHVLPAGTILPPGLRIISDGKDVKKSSRHGAGHHTIHPVEPMSYDEFVRLYLELPWRKGGRKS